MQAGKQIGGTAGHPLGIKQIYEYLILSRGKSA